MFLDCKQLPFFDSNNIKKLLILLTVVLYFVQQKSKVTMDENMPKSNEIISDRNELIAKVDELSKLLTSREMEFLNIFSNLSHELRTPLNGIIGFSELMSTTQLSPDEVKLYSSVVEESSLMLMATFNDAYDITRLHSGNYPIVKEPFDLNDLIFEIFVKYKPEAEKKNLQLFLENLISEPFIVHSAHNEVKKIITKLIENAIKYTKQGWVKLKYVTTPNEVIFDVEDTGIGVDANVVSKLFNSFIAEDVSKSRHVSGTGIDLTLCNGLVNTLGGKMNYLAKEAQGSIFRFSFKIAE
jgi:signal transduction histidine kinase